MLLILLPATVFRAAVQVLIAIAVVLVAIQPWLSRLLSSRPAQHDGAASLVVRMLIFGAAIYGGYFGAAQSIIIFALLTTFIADTSQRLNALKVVNAVVVNAVAAAVFVIAAPVDWSVVAEIALGSIVGGFLGAAFGRRMSATALRAAMIVVACLAIVRFVSF